MRKIKDVLRLYFELSLAQRQIAESVSLGQATVSDYLHRFDRAQLTRPVTLSEEQLEAKLFPASITSSSALSFRASPRLLLALQKQRQLPSQKQILRDQRRGGRKE
jgi:hypothetical protein